MIRVLTILVTLAFACNVVQSLILQVRIWRLTDKRRTLNNELPKLRRSYDLSIRLLKHHLRVRHTWTVALIISLCLLECLP